MRKGWMVFGVAILLVLGACAHNGGAVGSVATVVGNTANGLRINVALPEGRDSAIIGNRQENYVMVRKAEHFSVVLTNVSDHDVRVVRENNSWGDVALHFEFVDASGTKYVIQKAGAIWTANTLGYWTLHAGDPLVIEVCLGAQRQGKDMWRGLPDLSMDDVRGNLTAVFEFGTAKTSDHPPVALWTGTIRSEAVPCILTVGR